MSLSEKINSVRKEFLAEFNLVNDDLTKNEFLKTKYLSRKGIIAELFNLISTVSDKEKPEIGKKLNVLKKDLTQLISENTDSLKASKNNKLNITDWDYSFQILDLAKAFDFSLDLLFSSFFMIFGKSSKKSQKERDIKKLENFLEDLRFPQKARQLCLETAKYNQIGHKLLESSPEEILDLLKKFKAFHQGHTMFPDYLKCIEVESKILYGNEKSSEISSRMFFLMQELKNLDITHLKSKFQGKELGEAIDKARKELIISIIQKP